MTKRILLVGGGSGGHAYPLVAVAQALRAQATQRNITLELLMLGEPRFLEKIAPEAGVAFKTILAARLRRTLGSLPLLDVLFLPLAFIQSLWQLFWFMPDAVFSKGGFDSAGPVLAAKLYFIPVYLHESDTIPGAANRLLARFAQAVFTGFASADKYFPGKAVYVGNPVRPELFTADRAAAVQSFSFSPDRKTLLIFGGSQGAKQINDVILAALVELVRDYQIIHQCGDSQYTAVRAAVDVFIKEGKDTYGKLIQERYRLYPFLNQQEMAQAYAAGDIVISRAGAGSLFEIAQLSKPAIVVPLPGSANDHQLANALEFGKTGAPIIEGANMTTHVLMSQIHALLEPAKYSDMSQRVKTFATPEAAAKIATAILDSLR